MAEQPLAPASPFQQALYEHVARKRRSLKNKGIFEVEWEDRHGESWLVFKFRRAKGPHVIAEYGPKQTINLYARSAHRNDRGRILLRWEDLRVIGNVRRLRDVLIETLATVDYCSDNHADLERMWQRVTCRIVEAESG